MSEYSVVGKRLPRLEGVSKSTGEAFYTDDLNLPRMLHGKILRSPLPHARILNIDASRALALPGVKAVVTGKDTKGAKYGVYARTSDQQCLAVDKVRYMGDEVAAVAAVDEDTAQEALSLIKVQYEELPAVFDPLEAMEPGAPAVHEVERNICGKNTMNYGNVEEGFRDSHYIRQDRFSTGAQAHCALEPHVAVASWETSGKLTVWTPNMSPFAKRLILAKTLGIPQSHIRVCKSYIGGAFGGKSELFSLDFCASLLSIKTGRPVKIRYTREEVFTTTRLRHPMIMEVKTGVRKDGTIMAREIRVIGNTGSYASTGILAVYLTCSSFFKTYRIPNLRYEGYCVYTNNPPSGAMRAHGTIQARFADESHLDMIAEELKMDPVEFRLKNARQTGDVYPNKSTVISCGLSDCITQAAEVSGWKEKRNAGTGARSQKAQVRSQGNRGVGMGCTTGLTSLNLSAFTPSAAFVKFNEDGRANLLTGAPENGQGTETMLAQICAEELGLGLDDIVVTAADTDVTPHDIGSYLMALTFVSGNAVKNAAADARKQVLEVASGMLEAPPDKLEAKNRRIYIKGRPERGLSFAEVIRQGLIKGVPILGKGHYMPNTEYLNVATGEGKFCPTYTFSSQVSEVEVDRETGEIKVLKATTAHDCGFAINPLDVEGQIQGCVATSQGLALSESVYWQEGKMLNPDFLNYGIPCSLDMPAMKPIIVESHDPEGPFGGKDAGETPTHVGPAAIANAIYNAAGVRIQEIPMTPDKVLKALEENRSR